MGKMKAAQIT